MLKIINSAKLIFWDFDGVIKDSVDVKTQAFKSLFLPYGAEVAARICSHHESNGGVSRFEKIPLYLTWSGLDATEQNVSEFCDRFSASVLEAVVNSPWVPGVLDYLNENYQNQYFVLVTATPHSEIKIILNRLNIAHLFQEVWGAPTSKSDAIAIVMGKVEFNQEESLMIGDAESDMIAAQSNGIPFLLRRTPINASLQVHYQGPQLDNFNP
ncbi:hypothetical protein CENA302_01805 [Cylindrospermopsis raciborskii CENA302]|uniref:HAD family hydrolase n=1 Tax=Cylindrospermopsis raciborskii CENA302 TaxID=1170768 RepID=A0A9Q5QYT7_9CYAN|nr:hypothetical protein CENA302_01805 [Cylindrospermopsis raciborskii CENA302]